jgi:hypothetical protein
VIRFTWGRYPRYPIGCTVFNDALAILRLSENDPVGAFDAAERIDGRDDERRLCHSFGVNTWPPNLDHLNDPAKHHLHEWRIVKKDMDRSTATHEWFCITAAVSYDTRPPERRLPCFWIYLPIKGDRYVVNQNRYYRFPDRDGSHDEKL